MIDRNLLLRAYRLMYSVKVMSDTYEANRQITRYVHSTSRGHEAIQLATAFQLNPSDWVSPYYRDESMLLGMGWTPYELMLQLLTKGDDPFTGGRSYYSHPNSKDKDKPGIIHQSSATGMQVIPTTGVAQGLKYLSLVTDSEKVHTGVMSSPASEYVSEGTTGNADNGASSKHKNYVHGSIVICSLGDASVTEGEVSEALQFAVLKQLPIIYLVQDNDWGISVTAEEGRAMDAYEYAAGFKGLNRIRVDGTDFFESYEVMQRVIEDVRQNQRPWLVHAKVCLLNHHTSGVRKEFYRSDEDLAKHALSDPLPKFRQPIVNDFGREYIEAMERQVEADIARQFEKAVASADPDPKAIEEYVFVPTPIIEETGERAPFGNNKVIMVDAALFAIRELMEDDPRCVLYGQDVGKRLGGVFREAATLGEQFGDNRVFNTAIQEAYIIGSTVGMSAVGLKPIVEVQFGDYIYPGFNQLVTEISKSCYLSMGKFPISTIIRVPVGAYGGGGPYHSGCVESTLLSIKGIKIAYPSNAADMKGLMKAAYYDPNPVVMLEHKGLYWSKVPGTEDAKTIEPSRDYILPFGKGAIVLEATRERLENGESVCIITYGMGVYWAKAAAKSFNGAIEVIDLRTLFPLDEELVFSRVRLHGKCLVLTEEQQNNSFAEALAGRISKTCFHYLDAPVEVMGALNIPAVPLNIGLEAAMLPNAEKLIALVAKMLRS
ncbi:alpha-ketoacid dehydrogenase subunit alpha/beta [Flavisolibacter ginsengisoli]|jgi:2-oxoisovalerate dehydrogenase E1 component|uniref:3-methyl-2-oxobutanoate dehydrogenase (2-methylpropanoyl-transferring) n=1 Tax=Flavisolibacter ginsengisoli DSM 18119 TaxID=1121884 RepID=A0A1M5D6X2_9BACT|nr:alpha-ketoacid dehydrogenase subunit alpha/beta [Flavisolibacter ginsengisoli]SHF62748.1 2-oxoisovalerate dehydrogenase E1 component [Flavisolibacter ginsengisoli DSM 18119]